LSIRLHPKLDQFRQKLERGGMKTIITRQEYSRIFECNERTARRDLADLEMKNVIVMGKSGATKLFRLNAVFSTYVDMGGLGGR
jgi:Fic family protein